MDHTGRSRARMELSRRGLVTVLAAAVAWGGVLLQLVLTLKSSLASGTSITDGLIIYLGYFTILTNILVALVLTLPKLMPDSWAARFVSRGGVRTATAAAITVVGVAYFLLLRKAWNPQGWQLGADVMLHYLTPILFVVFWWVVVPKQWLRWSHAVAWSSYPIGYFMYMLIRGELTGLYPYPFLDVTTLGYGATLVNSLGVLAGFVLVSLFLILVGRWQHPRPTDGLLGFPIRTDCISPAPHS